VQSPTGINAIAGRSASQVWAVGNNGITLYWNGSVWTQQNNSLGRSLDALWVTPDTVWAGGLSGTILKRTGP
jgi:photosystem II stability/assembly factor-like uncharacterized protein